MAETATDAIYRALRSPEPDPDLVHAAVEEIRDLSGQNVIAVIGSQIAELKAELKLENAEIRAGGPAGPVAGRAGTHSGPGERQGPLRAIGARAIPGLRLGRAP